MEAEPRPNVNADAPSSSPAAAVAVSSDLFLGASSSPTFTAKALTELGVTHLLNCTPAEPDQSGAFASWRVPIADDMHAPLHEHLQGAAEFIDAALAAGGRVCAFCIDGRSTAPAVLAFYLMRHRQLSLADALDAIAAVRPDAQPNVGFWQRLVEAESWLRFSGADGVPSVSLQEYKWRFLERHCGAERGAVLQSLELGRAEVETLISVHSGREQWTSADKG